MTKDFNKLVQWLGTENNKVRDNIDNKRPYSYMDKFRILEELSERCDAYPDPIDTYIKAIQKLGYKRGGELTTQRV